MTTTRNYHREAHPEQYTHPMCGKVVAVVVDGIEQARDTVERVVDSRFGPLVILADYDTSKTAWALDDCTEVPALTLPEGFTVEKPRRQIGEPERVGFTVYNADGEGLGWGVTEQKAIAAARAKLTRDHGHTLRDQLIKILPREVGGWALDQDYHTGAFSFQRDDFTVYVSPWWEGTPGVAVQVCLEGDQMPAFCDLNANLPLEWTTPEGTRDAYVAAVGVLLAKIDDRLAQILPAGHPGNELGGEGALRAALEQWEKDHPETGIDPTLAPQEGR